VNAEFNWWLLIVGLVIGAGLVWLVLADSRRRDVDISEGERASEARWIAEALADAGRHLEDDEVLEVLRLHAEYLAGPPPDEPVADPLEDPWVAVPDAEHRPPPVRPVVAHDAERGPMAHPIARRDGEGGSA
jgi:hypothetical protein